MKYYLISREKIMLQKFIFFICIMIGIVSATQIINVNNADTNFKLEQVSQEVLNVNVTTGDIISFSTMTSAGEFVRLNLSGYHLCRDEGDPELPEIHNLIEIPQNAEPRIEIIINEFKDYSLSDLGMDLPIYPAQPSLSKSQQ